MTGSTVSAHSAASAGESAAVLLRPAREVGRQVPLDLCEDATDERADLLVVHGLAPELHEQARVGQVAGHALGHDGDDLVGVRERALAHPFVEFDHPIAEHALRDGERDLLLALEVPVDGAGRQPGLGDDVGHRGAVEALRGEASAAPRR